MITGQTLIDWGFKPGAWFKDALEEAKRMERAGAELDAIEAAIRLYEPVAPTQVSYRTNSLPFEVFLEPESEIEVRNLASVMDAMDALMRVPTVEAGAVMPDACPAGTIPVGGIVATKDAIHPGFHSADICCSMAITVFKRDMDLTGLLNVAQKLTHFGPGKRAVSQTRQHKGLMSLLGQFEGNRFLNQLESVAEQHFMTQGDGNHFLYVGRLASTGQPALVTHHGSRGLGAQLYKRGMAVAKKHKAIHSPKTPDGAAWIDAESEAGRAYWDALQIIRHWTRMNHFAIHEAIQQAIGNTVVDRFWNEHNFVFRKSDGLFYHAKGATPSFAGFSDDDDGRTLIPMNMAEPILITRHANHPGALGFSPHGAGRNLSRTAYMRDVIGDRDAASIMEEMMRTIDARFWLGTPDLSELPAAYKNADQVVRAIKKHSLAEIQDRVMPYGSIMAGEMIWNRARR